MSARLELDDGTRYPLTDQPVLIGRGDHCDIVLSHEKVSKRHARLTPGTPWTLEDLGSSNGTRIDDGPKLEPGEVTDLGPNARLTFGAVTVRFTNFSPPSRPIATPPADDATIPRSTRAQRAGTPAPATPIPDPPAAPTRAAGRSTARSSAPSAEESADRSAPSSRRARSQRRAPGAPRSAVSIATLVVMSLVIFGGLGAGLVWVYRWATPEPNSIARSDADPAESATDVGNPSRTDTPPERNDGGRSDGDPNATATARTPRTTAPNGETTPRAPRTAIGDEPFDDPGLVAPTSGSPRSAATDDSGEEPSVTVTPPPSDPFARASETQNAATLAELLRANRGHPAAASVRARLEAGTIVSIRWRGALPAAAHEVLGQSLPLHCTPQEESAIRAVAPNAVFVPCTIAIDYRQDYTRGLGRKIGKARLAPHPKTVEWTITREQRGKQVRVAAIEAKTPRIPAADLGDLGLSEREVWSRTVDRRAEKLRNALGRLTR